MTNSNLRGATTDPGQLDPERRLALLYVPAAARPAVEALWQLDAHLGTVLAAGTQLMLTQMKLAWWREALAALDRGPAPAEPILQRVEQHLLSRGLKGGELAEMTVGWEHLLADQLTPEDLVGYSELRGGLLFRYSAELLGSSSNEDVEAAGMIWALADLARRSSRADERSTALELAKSSSAPKARWPTRLRSLGMLAALATRDAITGGEALERQGSPARLLRMLSHRLTGR